MISTCNLKKDRAFVLLGIKVMWQPMNVLTLMNAHWPLMKNIDWPIENWNILSRYVTNQQSVPILSAVLNVSVRKVYLVMAYCHVMISMNVSRHVSSWANPAPYFVFENFHYSDLVLWLARSAIKSTSNRKPHSANTWLSSNGGLHKYRLFIPM